jgi:hypothetical protein
MPSGALLDSGRTRLLGLAFLTLLSSPGQASSDPEAALRQLRSSELSTDEAVHVRDLGLDAGLADVFIEEGTLFPTSPVAGRVVEMVFLGRGRFRLEPPDAIEAGQLELFTGNPKLDEPFQEAVLVVAQDAASRLLLEGREPAAVGGPEIRRAGELYDGWRTSRERELLDVEGSLLADAVGDPLAEAFFAARFHSEHLGDFIYLVDPYDMEQVTLGQFVPLDAEEKAKRKLRRLLHQAQKRGRFIGLEVEDLGRWDAWLSTSLADPDGGLVPGGESFEPRKYTIEARLHERTLTLRANARVDLVSLVEGSRIARFRLHTDLQVDRVTDHDGNPLFHLRSGSNLIVDLGAPVRSETVTTVSVEYTGEALVGVDKDTYVLADSLNWYPHAGATDRATYEVTLHWPGRLDLVASGSVVEADEDPSGRRRERRVLDVPTVGFGFSLGRYVIERVRAGDLDVEVAFDKRIPWRDDFRKNVGRLVADCLVYFEETFGPLPFDHLTVVTVPRLYSQGLLGFVTLAEGALTQDAFFLAAMLWREDRRTTIAHELAHQWWGHLVGWRNYRDQWISEAMANYSASLFARRKIGPDGIAPDSGPTADWSWELSLITPSGRPVEALGPLVLGERLDSTRGFGYTSIVYKKGALVLEMLSHLFGEEGFNEVLAVLVEAVSNREISTEQFFDLLEHVTQTDLTWFVEQYVRGTGIPEVYYEFEFVPGGEGQWTARGVARQATPYRYVYSVVRNGGGKLDVARRPRPHREAAASLVVVPVEIRVHDPAREEAPKEGKRVKKKRKDVAEKGNADMETRLVLKGEETPFEFELTYEPHDLWLDRDGRTLGRFYCESREPKRIRYYRALDLHAEGQYPEAAAMYRRALESVTNTDDETREEPGTAREGRRIDGSIHLGLAWLHMDQGDDLAAARAIESFDGLDRSVRHGLKNRSILAECRLALRRGEFEPVHKRLRRLMLGQGSIASTEGYLMLAIAAKALGKADDLDTALEVLRNREVDTSLLEAE